ncbi:MAG: magnesium transporter [Betaproteobacteria bacterium]|nr:magnesium transporter [Betaproteobacteria bacterium]MDH5350111.1 magnesium transporter [Betaproteobacteria bacterium]
MKHHETVGGHLVASVLRARPEEHAGDVLARLAAEKPASLELVLATDAHGRLLGAAPLARVLALESTDRVDKALERDFPRVRPNTDQERAASLALHHRVDALPVVDAEGCVLGVMPSQAIMQVLRREHVEDLHVLAGIQRETSQARHAIEDPPMRRLRHRLPWLLVGLGGAAFATATMAGFEATLRAHVAVAFFVPAIVYLADAIGTQSEAVAVRGLSLTRSGIGHLLAGELRTGMSIGAVLGLISFLPVWFFFGSLRLAGAVSVAVFAAGAMAAALGLLLPWWLARTGRDPALGSGPLATVIQDILSLLVYLAVVRAFGL